MNGGAQRTIGGGIAPAAIGGLIEGAPCSVNAFRAARGRRARPENADKVLMRLNFPYHTIIGRLHSENDWLEGDT